MNRFLTLSALALALSPLATAQTPPATQATPLPPDVRVEEKLGNQIPLDLPFKNEEGKDVTLRDYFGKKPVALMLIFYKCGGTCLQELQQANQSFRALKTYDIGREFDVLTVSIHPKEEPWLAKSTKGVWIEQYGRPTGDKGWHFLTGPEKSSRTLADSVGFYYHYLPNEGENGTVRHANALIVLTPEGKVSQYFKGLLYPQKLLLGALQMAAEGQIGESNPTEAAGACIGNPTEGKYSALVTNVVRVGGLLFLAGLGGTMFLLTKKGRAPGGTEEPSS